ncbi:MAG: protein kinase, partial [Candidatus Cloacimonadota bacterium]|nr:protein kinase [Candidatus Cloacimonadota bacterium]
AGRSYVVFGRSSSSSSVTASSSQAKSSSESISSSIIPASSSSSSEIKSNSSLLINKNSSSTSKGTNLGVIIGGVIGGSLLLCLITGTGIGYLIYRKRKNAEQDDIAMEVNSRPSKQKRISLMEKDGKQSMSLVISYKKIKKLQKIGGGGSGIVYKGRWQNTYVAIKQLTLMELDPKAEVEFTREASIMSALRHPNIVEFYGVCLEPECCIVMEYMTSGSLHKLLHSDEEITWELRERIALDIAQGLDYLHENNVVHRDLKSLNILLDENKRAKLTDFGLSKERTDTTLAPTTKNIGTPGWMPPEILMDEEDSIHQGIKTEYTKKADIYSYGIILWEISSRKVPFAEAKHNMEIMKSVVKGIRPEIPLDCPIKFSNLIQRCWTQRPEERPDISEVEKELELSQIQPS